MLFLTSRFPSVTRPVAFLGLLGKIKRCLQHNVAPRTKVVGRDVYRNIRSDADPLELRAIGKGVMDRGDIENHAVVESRCGG